MLSEYLSNKPMVDVFSNEALIEKFLLFERALASVHGEMGIIPADAAKEINDKLRKIDFDIEQISKSFLVNGIPTLALLDTCSSHLTQGAKEHLHIGASSQDVIDSSHIMMYQDAFGVIETLVNDLLDSTVSRIKELGQVIAVARTRTQQAGTTTYGVKIVGWIQPIFDLSRQVSDIKAFSLNVQLAGAFGNNAALGDMGDKVARQLAKSLGLSYSGPWHTNRLGIKIIADWCTSISAACGKIAKDILFLSSNEVGEMIENRHRGGKSSSMPHKSNPILSEAIFALAKSNNVESLKINESCLHGNERDGAAWILEWITMKTIFTNTATCLSHLVTIMNGMELKREGIERNLNLSNGLIYSALAAIKLKKLYSGSEANKILNSAMEKVKTENIQLSAALNQVSAITEDWEEILKPDKYLGGSEQIVGAFLEKVNSRS